MSQHLPPGVLPAYILALTGSGKTHLANDSAGAIVDGDQLASEVYAWPKGDWWRNSSDAQIRAATLHATRKVLNEAYDRQIPLTAFVLPSHPDSAAEVHEYINSNIPGTVSMCRPCLPVAVVNALDSTKDSARVHQGTGSTLIRSWQASLGHANPKNIFDFYFWAVWFPVIVNVKAHLRASGLKEDACWSDPQLPSHPAAIATAAATAWLSEEALETKKKKSVTFADSADGMLDASGICARYLLQGGSAKWISPYLKEFLDAQTRRGRNIEVEHTQLVLSSIARGAHPSRPVGDNIEAMFLHPLYVARSLVPPEAAVEVLTASPLMDDLCLAVDAGDEKGAASILTAISNACRKGTAADMTGEIKDVLRVARKARARDASITGIFARYYLGWIDSFSGE